MNGTYIVYCLYTEVEGIFYIGCGQTAHGKQKSRLGNTMRECQNARQANYSCLKCRIFGKSCGWRGKAGSVHVNEESEFIVDARGNGLL